MPRTFGFTAEQGLTSVNGKPVEGVAEITGNDITIHAERAEPIAPIVSHNIEFGLDM